MPKTPSRDDELEKLFAELQEAVGPTWTVDGPLEISKRDEGYGAGNGVKVRLKVERNPWNRAQITVARVVRGSKTASNSTDTCTTVGRAALVAEWAFYNSARLPDRKCLDCQQWYQQPYVNYVSLSCPTCRTKAENTSA